jgi:UDPglucose 6-dehydrogenase
MNVCVLGLWHLGTVTAACLAEAGHEVVGIDFDEGTVGRLRQGIPPIFEPGLEELVRRGLSGGHLSFTTDLPAAVKGAPVVWVAYDTPVDEDDRADVEFVMERVARLIPHVDEGTLVLISSQLPAGSTARLETMCRAACPGKRVSFACSPENLRLGKAIAAFTRPDRVVVGIRPEADRECVVRLLSPITDRLEWMSVESAEMTKHALNAFLAASVAFANELASLCELVGADAKEVERGLKTEPRIGPKAYLSPGGAFAGGTLARDISFLEEIGAGHLQPTPLFSAVKTSNDAHRRWPQRKILGLLGDLNGKTVSVWGLTYKPGTDTLRRSASVELCRWLAGQGAVVRAHDPAVKVLPPDLSPSLILCPTPVDALEEANALVVATEWPEYLSIDTESVVGRMKEPVVIDANRFLAKTLGADPKIHYVAVGKPRT